MKALLLSFVLIVTACSSGYTTTGEDARVVTTYVDKSGTRCFYLEATNVNDNAPTGTYCKQ